VAVAGGLSMGVGFGIQGGGVQLHQPERGLRAPSSSGESTTYLNQIP
jgi:hypothetical protein